MTKSPHHYIVAEALEKELALAHERLADPTSTRWDLAAITPAHARYVVKAWPKRIAASRRNADLNHELAESWRNPT